MPQDCSFQPLMTLYLTDSTSPDDVKTAKAAGIVAYKLYPAGATTNSQSGVTDISKCMPALEAMMEVGSPRSIFSHPRMGVQYCQVGSANIPNLIGSQISSSLDSITCPFAYSSTLIAQQSPSNVACCTAIFEAYLLVVDSALRDFSGACRYRACSKV